MSVVKTKKTKKFFSVPAGMSEASGADVTSEEGVDSVSADLAEADSAGISSIVSASRLGVGLSGRVSVETSSAACFESKLSLLPAGAARSSEGGEVFVSSGREFAKEQGQKGNTSPSLAGVFVWLRVTEIRRRRR